MIGVSIDQHLPTRPLDEVQQLFGSTNGAWYIINPSTCFVDHQRTTPAFVGSRIGGVLDQSGNNRHLTQDTTANKPFLRQESTGHFYLEFEGNGDHMNTGVFLPGGKGQRYVATAVDMTPDPSRTINHIIHGGQDSPNRAWGLCNRLANINNLSQHYWAASYDSGIAATAKDIYSGMVDSAEETYRAAVAGLSATQAIPVAMDTNGTHTTYRLFARVNLGIEYGIGKLYSCFIINRALTTNEHDTLMQAMAATANITLGGGNQS